MSLADKIEILEEENRQMFELLEKVVGVYGKYLPSHYECVLRKA